MKIVRTVAEIRRIVAEAPHPLGFVPTMGALHAGHLALFRTARAECAAVVASIFVNPLQFNDPADLASYPRNEAADAEAARGAGVDVLFVPGPGEIYPPGHATAVDVQGPALGFEGDHRPGHFRGVATVCVKLFNIVQADAAYFGQKDAQQVAVIRRIVRDLDLPLEIRVVPTVRDPDGLALSSRNLRLSADDRRRALAIPRAMREALAAQARGDDPIEAARQALGDLPVEYVGVARFDGRPTLVVAVRVGAVRLIDNVPFDEPRLAGLQAR